MSWIIGFVGNRFTRARREGIAALVRHPIVERSGRTYYLAAGGLPETCAGGDLPQGHWCVVGTGVRIEEGQARLFSPTDWRRRLMSQRPRLDRLGGGFVAIRFGTRRVEALADPLGLRTLYWHEEDDGILFSTRPDWLSKLAGGFKVDPEALGSHWLAYNQLSYRSLVRGVGRLAPGGRVEMTDQGVESESSLYTPRPGEKREFPSDLLVAQLHALDDRTISLGLSGGMDSRTLLALLPRRTRSALHVFGPKIRQDVQIALGIAEDERLPFSHFHVPPNDRDELLRVVRDHVVQAQAVSPASAALSLRYYPELRAQNKLVVDGGFGEILRRQFMNRLIRRGRSAVLEKGVAGAFDCVRFERAKVFTPDAYADMIRGAHEDMLGFLDVASEWMDIGMRNAIDLMNVRMRLPNFFGYEQPRLDELVQNFMPFAHPHVIDAVFRIAARNRAGSRVSRHIIASHAPRLRRYELVKGDVSYPYGLPGILSTLYVKVKKRFEPPSEPPDRTLVLKQLKEFILDRMGSSRVRNGGLYDPARLDALAAGYYRDGQNGAQLDWWLALELWRSAIEDDA